MMKRILLMVVAAAAISAPAVFTPAAAQANLDINIGIPGPVPFFDVAPQPTYYAYGNPGYYRRWEDRRWEGRRAWDRDHWRHEEWREHHFR